MAAKRVGMGIPICLHLTLFAGRPLLMDFGTASYVSPSLHWYRSTLAHNAPGLSGLGQTTRTGWCAAFDKKGDWGWCRAVAEDLFGSGSSATRTLVLGPGVLLDVVDVEAPDDVSIDLPVHLLDPAWSSLDEWSRLPGQVPAFDDTLGNVVELDNVGQHDSGGRVFKPRSCSVVRARRLLAAERPGPPDDQFADGAPMAFLVRRASGAGRWVQCYGWPPSCPVGVASKEFVHSD